MQRRGIAAGGSVEEYNAYRMVEEDIAGEETFKPRHEEGRDPPCRQVPGEVFQAQGEGSTGLWMGNAEWRGGQCGQSR